MAGLYEMEQLYGFDNQRNTIGMQRLEYLKSLHSEIANKRQFAEDVAKKVGKSFDYVRQTYLQREWSIPAENLESIISVAEKTIRKQIRKQEKVLKTI